jgi:hypothetical protein
MMNQPLYGYEVTDQPIEADMAKNILLMLPQLKQFYGRMNDLTADWNVNEMPAKIETSMKAGQPLAGYSPAFFAAMGAGFLALAAAMQQPIPLPPEVLTALGIKEFTLEFAIRNKWLSEAAKQPQA